MATTDSTKVNRPIDILVRDLSVAYGSVEVLQGITFSVAAGEFLGVVGKSGTGKTTLLLALAGFIDFQGHVQVPTNIGVVFQNYAVFPWLTVRQNIAFGLNERTRKDREKIITRHLELTGLQGQRDKYPAQLSGGQAQRVALARALAADPQVILMDEPMGALDLVTREEMQNWLLQVWEEDRKTLVYTTHGIEESLLLSDRVLVLGHGRIAGEFPVPFDRPRKESIKFSRAFIEL